MQNKKYYVYILECSDKTLYIGKTFDLKSRIDAHNGILRGGAKYTRGRRPVVLKYFEEFLSQTDALQREWNLKCLTKEEKEKLVGKTKSSDL